MHWKILKHYSIKANDKCYEHQPETVTGNEKVTILWDIQVHTHKTIKANKPDIIIRDRARKTCMLIVIPSDRNLSVKAAEKLFKYKGLEIEITKMIENKNSACCHRGTWSTQGTHRKTH